MSANNKLFCQVRQAWVAATPEERLRQSVLSFMFGEGGYPRGLTALESPIKRTSRRADIVAYCNHSKNGLLPLIVVECKAIHITQKMLQQVGGYNYDIKAPFIALASPYESYWGWMDANERRYRLNKGFPTYSELLNSSVVQIS